MCVLRRSYFCRSGDEIMKPTPQHTIGIGKVEDDAHMIEARDTNQFRRFLS